MTSVALCRDGDTSIAATRADSFVTRARGLLGRPRLEPGVGLLISPCTSVHTCFMAQSLDLVGLAPSADGEVEVTWTAAEVKPWRLRFASRGTREILELAAGEVARLQLRVGDSFWLEDTL